MPSIERTIPKNLKQKDLAIFKNSAVGLYAVQHRKTREMFIVGTRQDCFDFYRRYE